MTKYKVVTDGVVSEGKFLQEIREYFGVSAEEIKSILKELDDANGQTEALILTEQFNLGFIAGMKESAKQLEKFFEENLQKPVQDFREIEPTANVVNITQEDIVPIDNKEIVVEEITDSIGRL